MSIPSLDCPLILVKPQPSQAEEITSHDFHIFQGVDDIPRQAWQEVVSEKNDLLSYDYLKAVERACKQQVDFRYALIKDRGRMVGFVYFQIFSMDWERLSASVSENNPRNLFERLKSEIGKAAGKLALRNGSRLMVCGNSFVSGSYGFCFKGVSREKERAYLLSLTQQLRKAEKDVIAVLMKDLPPEEEAFWAQDGYQRFFADPNMLLRLRPEWNSFDDYVQAMSSKYRQRLRSAYKKSKGLEHRWLSADEVRSYQKEIFDLFSEVLREDQFSLLDVPKGYFTLVQRKTGNRFSGEGLFSGRRTRCFFHCPAKRYLPGSTLHWLQDRPQP
jgi:hypothetical protein